MKIGVIGCGVVGGAFVKAARQKGFQVSAFDKNLKEYNSPMDELLGTEMIFLCLPTPTEGIIQDTSALRSVLSSLMSEEYRGPVVIKSTVLPGTIKNLAQIFPSLAIVHNPEFLTEANSFQDMMNQPMVLLGSDCNHAVNIVEKFWNLFDPELRVMRGTSDSTEFAKYMHNCFLAVKVSFFNEMYEACVKLYDTSLYLNALEMAIGVGKIGGTHTRVPGPDGQIGFGGMCFPKDTSAMLGWGDFFGVKMETLEGAVTGNKRRRRG